MGQRNIGGGGEHFFKAWCNMVGIVANSSDSDMNGWDLFIEIDRPGNICSPLTVHQGNMEAKVQIKATDGRKKSVDVELSNLWKMSTTLLPAFYILIEFDSKELPVKAYVRHVDKDLVVQVLGRVTKLVAKDSKVKLNKKKMRVNFKEEFSVQDLSTLKALLDKYMGSSSSQYSEKKKEYLEQAGFEGGGYKISFTIADMEQLEKFTDASLGKNVDVQVKGMHGSLVRFGLSTHIPSLSASNAVLSLLKVLPDDVGKVAVRDRSTGKSLVFDADFYRGAVNRFLPEGQQKIRVDAKFFEIFMRYGNQSINITMTVEIAQSYCVDDLLKVFSLFEWLREPNGLEMSLNFFGTRLPFILKENESPKSFAIGVSMLKDIVELKNYFELSQPLVVTLFEIESRIDYVSDFIQRFANSKRSMCLSFDLEGDFVLGDVNCFYVAFLRIGQYLFVELISLVGALVEDKMPTGSRLKVESETKISLYKTVVEFDEKVLGVLKEDICAAMDSYESELPGINFTPLFFDMNFDSKNDVTISSSIGNH
jgi:hypothetical protein